MVMRLPVRIGESNGALDRHAGRAYKGAASKQSSIPPTSLNAKFTSLSHGLLRRMLYLRHDRHPLIYTEAEDGPMISQIAVSPGPGENASRVRPAHVMSVAASRDGRQFAVTTRAGSVEIRDVASRSQLHRLPAHDHWATTVAFSPDRRFVASGGYDRSVKVWSLTTSEGILTLNTHELGVTALAFDPTGRRLASASWDGTARIWDLESGRELLILGAHLGGALAVTFSPDGAQLATAGQEGAVRLWRADDGSPIRILPGHARAVYTLAYRADGRQLASGGEDRAVKVWDLAGQPVVSCLGHTAAIQGLAFHPDGRLIPGGTDGTLRVWDPSSGRELHSLNRPGFSITCVALAGDSCVISGGTDGTVRFWALPALSASGQELVAPETIPVAVPSPPAPAVPRFLPQLRPAVISAATHLLFTLDEQVYALAASEVLGVLRPEGIAAVPEAPGWLRGVVSLRGTPLPVVDLAHLLEVDARSTGAHLVLLRGRSGDIAGAVLVDRVLGLRNVTVEPDATKLPGCGPNERHLRVGRDTDGRQVLIMDPSQLPAPEEARVEKRCLIGNGHPA
jgi:WD40 repeat protein